MPDAIALLKQDHEKAQGLLEKLSETTTRGTKTRTELRAKVLHELRLHMQIEEEILYPALREAAENEDDEKLFHEATIEHRLADKCMATLERCDPEDVTFSAAVKVLKDVIDHHIEEEEEGGEDEEALFTRIRELLGDERLKEMGEQI